MAPKIRWRRLRVRELLFIAGLGALLACTMVPVPSGRSSDAIGQDLGLLQAGSAPERTAAATELARLAGKDAQRIIPALIHAAADQDAQVRRSAIDALHVVDADGPFAGEAINVLIAALRDPAPRVRATAAGVLSNFNPAPRAAIPGLAEAAISDRGQQAHLAAPAAALASPLTARQSIERSQWDHARASAAAALGKIGRHDPGAQESLVKLAADPVAEVRMVVARILGELGPGPSGAFDAEVTLTSDSDMYIQARAVAALGSFPGDYVKSCPILYRAYLSKERPLQEGAELSLGRIVKSGAFDAGAAGHSNDAALRFAAVFGLAPDSQGGLQAIVAALVDKDPGVRKLAVTRLGAAPSRFADAALKALDGLAADRDPDVRSQVGFSRQMLARKKHTGPD
jgi:HEAT repeat protein